MIPEITDLIKKKAEKYVNKIPAIDYEFGSYKNTIADYTTGQIEAIEMMIGFIEWMAQQDLKLYKEGWCQPGGSNGWHESTVYFLDKYIKEVL